MRERTARPLSQRVPLNRLKGMDKPFDCAERVWADFLSVLDTLPPTTRAVFLLHALFDASVEDIERTLGVRSEACRRHLEAARHAMHNIKGDST